MNVAIGRSARVLCCVLWLTGLPPASASAVQVEKASIPPQIHRILKQNCFKCHGVAKSEGQLQLHSVVRIWRGGESGTAVVPGDPGHSPLWQRVANDEMPPEQPLMETEKQLLHDWIAAGARGLPSSDEEAAQMQRDEHWAFTKLSAIAPPPVQHPQRCQTPIDQFVQAELERLGLELGPDIDRSALIRRLCFSLTGLPPHPDEIEKFVTESRPDAVATLIDRLLASPQYGVRWGKHWLDAAGYADSNGYFNADSDRPLAHQYRDYVVRSINADKPFDQFVREQIAGDELSGFKPDQHRHQATPEMIEMLIATHYLRNGQDGSGESDGNPDEVRIDRYTALESAQQIIASSLLGLTLQCAKCHDHKFEPISQLDFYRFQSVLYPAYNPDQWIKPNDRVTHASLPEDYDRWQADVTAASRRTTELQSSYREWIRKNRVHDLVLFEDDFERPEDMNDHWTATIPGDDCPAGTAKVTLRTSDTYMPDARPAALIASGRLQIIEGGQSGDKWLSTQQTFDWTPEEENQWVQVTFDLVDNKVFTNESPAERIAFGIALHDFNNNSSVEGGNMLIDGNPQGGAAVHLDYPGAATKNLGKIGSAKYSPNHSFGVRITRLRKGIFRLQQLVDFSPEGPHVDLKELDLPNGSFAFGYCCGRSYQVDNVVIESSQAIGATTATLSQAQIDTVEAFHAELKRRQAEIETASVAQSRLEAEEPGRISWVTDTTREPPEVYLLARGEYSQPAERVQPAAFSALQDEANAYQVVPPENGAASSGRRTAWAKWVTQHDSRAASLMARVQVNRIWQQHFGTGLVSTPENLGMSGAEPSNVALLDWLAGEFIRSGWSLKSIHRLILLSTVFRQSSLATEKALIIDPNNHLLWRYPIRRLDAESIRDAQLAISGELDLTLGGPYVATTRNGTAEVIVPEDRPGAHRRSIYLQQRRTQGLSLLSVFDAPAMVVNCTRRPVTTMPLQSLTLLNSEFIVKRGEQFAVRTQQESGDGLEAKVQRAFRLAVGRDSTDQELADSVKFIESQRLQYAAEGIADDEHVSQRAWSDFCQLLLASSPCLYVE